ncbi:SIMPL domain-containing protein [Synechococcus sp. RSCCF101]|uniref:SIMPL domain-containing protein n=1 Tax=Synechococcus sp. RSCCF101 TaxID=2511069 RepID=UPI00178537F0|nr:SIMPL domain-containing protein [Synechococcus sp. RSCCF101]
MTVQVRCDGTVIEAQGQARREGRTDRLDVSMGLTAEASTAEAALALLQQRLAVVRGALQDLGVRDLEVTSPSTSRRPEPPRPDLAVSARLRVRGVLAPARLQSLIREVGAMPGVSLAPVQARTDPERIEAGRQVLLDAAYRDAATQARSVAGTIGRPSITPLRVDIGSGAMPRPLMARADQAATPPFDPGELPPPSERLDVRVTFCAR